MTASNVTLLITTNVLSDKSKTYDVHIGNVVLHAVTKEDADELAADICNAINNYTNDIAEIVYA